MKFIFLFLFASNINGHWVSRCGLKCMDFGRGFCKEYRIVCDPEDNKKIDRVLVDMVSLIVNAERTKERDTLKDAEKLLMDCKK